MPLISSMRRNATQVLDTYKTPSGKITHILKTDIPGRGQKKQIIQCDRFDSPQKVIDIVNGKKEIYTKDKQGGTILQIGKKITELPHIAFSTICERIFK